MFHLDKKGRGRQPIETPENYHDYHRNKGNKRRKEKTQFSNSIQKYPNPKDKNQVAEQDGRGVGDLDVVWSQEFS